MITASQIARREKPQWDDDWSNIRNQFRISRSILALSHGAYGAVPVPVREYQAALRDRIDSNPTGFFRREVEDLLESARLEAAAFCGASEDGFAFVRNASEGLTVAIAAVPLAPDDEVIINNHTYPAVRMAIAEKCQSKGAKLIEVRIPFTDDDAQIVSIFADAITERTRLIIADQVSAPSGQCFPVHDIAGLAKKHGITLIIDGAHAPGMFPVCVDTLGADIWVGNFHKWVCAPHGAGGIWASDRWRERLQPSHVSFRHHRPYPRRFGRLGTDDLTAMLCVPVAIKFLRDIGLDKIYSYSSQLAAYGAEVVRSALKTPELSGRFAARHAIALPEGVALDDAGEAKLQNQIAHELHAEVSVCSPFGSCDRANIVISAFVYNHPDEYERFAHLLGEFLSIRRSSP